MSMQYIRESYAVPAKRGARVKFLGHEAVITSSEGQYLWIRFIGDPAPGCLRREKVHPTWEVEYL